MNRKQLPAAILLCVPAAGFFNILPIFLGAAAEDFGLAPDKIGFLSAIETGALAFTSLLGPLWIKRFNWRSMAMVATTIILAGNLLTMTVKSYEALLIVRMLTGLFGEGMQCIFLVAHDHYRFTPHPGREIVARLLYLVPAPYA